MSFLSRILARVGRERIQAQERRGNSRASDSETADQHKPKRYVRRAGRRGGRGLPRVESERRDQKGERDQPRNTEANSR